MTRKTIAASALLALAVQSGGASAQTAAFDRTVALSDHQQPAIPRPDQDAAAAAKLADFERRATPGDDDNYVYAIAL